MTSLLTGFTIQRWECHLVTNFTNYGRMDVFIPKLYLFIFSSYYQLGLNF